MQSIDGIVKLAENEFEAIVKNGKFRSREEIDSAYKLMDIVKDANEIWCMEEEMMGSESEDGGMSYRGNSYERGGRSYRGGSYEGSYEGGSYARGRGRNARRDSMGRYSREGSYYRDGRSMRGYSRDDKEEYIEQLREMMEDAPDDNTRQSIQRMISQME